FAAKDKVGEFLRNTLEPTLRYTAKVAPDIAYSTADIDRAMKWGFGWELGPFEIMEALGLDAPRSASDAATSPSRAGAPFQGALSEITTLKAAKDSAP